MRKADWRHCEARSDEAISQQLPLLTGLASLAVSSLRKTVRDGYPNRCNRIGSTVRIYELEGKLPAQVEDRNRFVVGKILDVEQVIDFGSQTEIPIEHDLRPGGQ